MNRKEKKEDADYKFRVNETLKLNFFRACNANKTDAAKELRAFMERYVARNKYKIYDH